jgi:hypothetical protein
LTIQALQTCIVQKKMKYIRLYLVHEMVLLSTIEEDLGDDQTFWTSRGPEEGTIVGRDRVA